MDEFSTVKSNFFVNEGNVSVGTDIKIENEETDINLNGLVKIEDFSAIKNELIKVGFENNVPIKYSTMNVSDLNTVNNFSINCTINKSEMSTLTGLSRISLSWPSGTWENGIRRSAFLPYKPATVLTNLQRGNIQAKTQHLDVTQFTWHMTAGRGDLRLEDLMNVVDINERDEQGMTGLMWSCAYGQTSTVQRLLDRGSNPMVYANNRQTALHMAAFGGHHEIIRLLLAYGAEVNAIDEQGNTPLMYAVCEDHPHAVYELLLNDADLCIRNCNNVEAYKLAIERNCNQAKIVLETHIMHKLSSSSKNS